MRKPFAIFLNGPAHSGKSTIGAMLEAQLKGTTFLEGESLVGRAGRSPEEWVGDTILAGTAKLIEEAKAGRLGVLAFPLRNGDWDLIARACQREGITPICITLAPPLAVAISARGTRRLSTEDAERVRRMYDEGYHRREFSALTLDNGNEAPGATSQKVAQYLSSLTGARLW